MDEWKNTYEDKVEEWQKQQEVVSAALNTTISGVISCSGVVKQNLLEHVKKMKEQGYPYFNEYDLSLFERFYRTYEDDLTLSHCLFNFLKSLIRQMNKNIKPKENSINILVMMQVKYMLSVIDMQCILLHDLSDTTDLHLLWDLMEKLWVIGHPIWKLTSQDLDKVCDEIKQRKAALEKVKTKN